MVKYTTTLSIEVTGLDATMVDAQRAMMDQLMGKFIGQVPCAPALHCQDGFYVFVCAGKHRNLSREEQKAKQLKWNDPEVCPWFLQGFCPHELFINTKSDLGSHEICHIYIL